MQNKNNYHEHPFMQDSVLGNASNAHQPDHIILIGEHGGGSIILCGGFYSAGRKKLGIV